MATRKRPQVFKHLCETALQLADKPEELEFVSYHDVDDDSKYEYLGNHKEVYGERKIGIFQMANECQKIATGLIYMFTADDFFFEDRGWDTLVYNEFAKYDDKILFVCGEGSYWKNWRFAPVGFVHKHWCDALGYLLPPYDGAQGADKWINELSVAVGRRVRIPTRITHTNVKDEIHNQKNKKSREERWRVKYHSPEVATIREEDIKTLRSYIECFARTYNSVVED
jgi:hypothetical protein